MIRNHILSHRERISLVPIIPIHSGTVDLHNLPLKKTALKGLELPLEVKSGFISHLQLSIPLRRPKSEPWIVHINKLFLVAGPMQHTQVRILLLILNMCNKCEMITS